MLELSDDENTDSEVEIALKGVLLGPERITISNHVHTADDELMSFSFSYKHYDVEVLLAGDTQAPNPIWLELAERVCAQVDRFVSEAIDYLRGFGGGFQLVGDGEWHLDWMEFGRDLHSGLSWPFELIFVRDDDVYGGWGVLFADAGELRYIPLQVRRFQR